MVKESRIFVRLVALWIILIASVVVIFWAGNHFVISVVKMANGSYADSTCPPGGYCPQAMTLSSCIMAPPYPTSYPMGGGMGGVEIAAPDQKSMDKYNQDYQQYTEKYQEACKQDVMHSQGSQKNSAVVDIAGYGVFILFGLFTAAVSMMAIKWAEEI